MDDEAYYQIVSEELSENRINQALWTKAIAKSMGDEPKTKAVYIQLRVQQLMQETIRTRTESEEEALAPADFLQEVLREPLLKWGLKAIAVIALIIVILKRDKLGSWLHSLIG